MYESGTTRALPKECLSDGIGWQNYTQLIVRDQLETSPHVYLYSTLTMIVTTPDTLYLQGIPFEC